MPFGAEMCDKVVDLKPDVVSFHFGLPETSLVVRIKAAGCIIFSSATTVAEAPWLEDHGADAVIAQGASAVQMGTAYLLCPEATIAAFHRAALKSARDNVTVITNVLTGRPARVFMTQIVRELGPWPAAFPRFRCLAMLSIP
jgi:nitronate monooxygenase